MSGSTSPYLLSLSFELIHMIMDHLLTEDRLPLLNTCRRLRTIGIERTYRHLDLELATYFHAFPLRDRAGQVQSIRMRYGKVLKLPTLPLARPRLGCFAHALPHFKNIVILDLEGMECIPFIPFAAWQRLEDLRLRICRFAVRCGEHEHSDNAQQFLRVAPNITHLCFTRHLTHSPVERRCEHLCDFEPSLFSNIVHIGFYEFYWVQRWMLNLLPSMNGVQYMEWECRRPKHWIEEWTEALLAAPAPSSLLLISNLCKTTAPIALDEFRSIIPEKPGNKNLRRFEVQEFVLTTMWSTVWTREGGIQQSCTLMEPTIPGLPNEIMHMICGYLSFFDVRSLRNVCKETRARVPAPSGAARVSDYILPFFGDAGRFRSRCLAYYDCVIAGIVPFLSLAGLPIAPSDILDLFVTHMDAAALCNALEKQGCKFYVCPTGVVSASLLLSSLLQWLWPDSGATFPPTATLEVPLKNNFPGASKLAATARNGGDIDPVLASLTASTPEHRWIKVHVLKPQRPIRDVVYAMPSTAYLNFVCYNEIYSYALPMTFFHGIHVPFGRQRTLSPVQWPPRLQLRSVGREAVGQVMERR
ncbi:hypothetical protein ONZ45_g15293 [Pleurotus djamor]|nr:hypothetical protein ONZ45_g15293 [Pleurotus djamor]